MELFVEDLALSVRFYRDVLCFEPQAGATEEYTAVVSGGVELGICQRRALPADHHFAQEAFEGRKGVGVEIVLEVEDLAALYERVQKTGYPIHEPLQKRSWGSQDFRLVDPDGYYLRLTDSKVVAHLWREKKA